MNWEKVTAGEFEKAIDTCGGVCLLPLGVVEKHGDHLPLGQDTLFIHALCSRAAEKEPAMVFPPYYFGKINEARHQPGTIALKFDLLLPVLESVCDEIARNGFPKILIVNGHGGNSSFLPFFCESLLDKDKDYVVFYLPTNPCRDEVRCMTASWDGHGGESETSRALYFFPDLVKDKRAGAYGASRKRLEAYGKLGVRTALRWYANFPGHLCADQTPGSFEKGRTWVEAMIEKLVPMIRLLKTDSTPMELYREFRARARKPTLSQQ